MIQFFLNFGGLSYKNSNVQNSSSVIILGPHRTEGYRRSKKKSKQFLLPSNTTHYLQALDVSAFGKVKTKWSYIVEKFYKQSTNFISTRPSIYKSITKASFPVLLKRFKMGHFMNKPVFIFQISLKNSYVMD